MVRFSLGLTTLTDGVIAGAPVLTYHASRGFLIYMRNGDILIIGEKLKKQSDYYIFKHVKKNVKVSCNLYEKLIITPYSTSDDVSMLATIAALYEISLKKNIIQHEYEREIAIIGSHPHHGQKLLACAYSTLKHITKTTKLNRRTLPLINATRTWLDQQNISPEYINYFDNLIKTLER